MAPNIHKCHTVQNVYYNCHSAPNCDSMWHTRGQNDKFVIIASTNASYKNALLGELTIT